MKKRIAFPLVLLLLGCVTSDTGTQAQGRVSAEEETVRSLDDQERTAVLNRDLSALERLWSDQLTVNSPSNRVTVGKRDVLALVERGLIHYSSFERRIEFIRVDGDIAIIMGAETVQPIGDAPMAGQKVQRRFTNIWKKEATTWRLMARHANVVPTR
jgi:ketosteroid isomerase-like protein